jgi:hypothetical protein
LDGSCSESRVVAGFIVSVLNLKILLLLCYLANMVGTYKCTDHRLPGEHIRFEVHPAVNEDVVVGLLGINLCGIVYCRQYKSIQHYCPGD